MVLYVWRNKKGKEKKQSGRRPDESEKNTEFGKNKSERKRGGKRQAGRQATNAHL